MRSFLIATLFAVGLIAAAQADTTKPSSIKIDHPWLRATPKGAPVVGGYASITNEGKEPDRVMGASIPIAAAAEVHSMSMTNGIMHMERLSKGLAVAPGATVKLTPDGDHLMFLKPKQQIKEGQTIAGTIVFEKAGAVPVTFTVGGMGAKSAPGDSKSMLDMPGMDMTNH